jgi:hypothetical protein
MIGVMPDTRGRGVEGTSARLLKVVLDEAQDREGNGGRETIATVCRHSRRFLVKR